MGVVLFMYAKDVILSDSKNAFSGNYCQCTDHVLESLIKIPFQFLDSTGYCEKEVTALKGIILIMKLTSCSP